jgi:hypothetical protein
VCRERRAFLLFTHVVAATAACMLHEHVRARIGPELHLQQRHPQLSSRQSLVKRTCGARSVCERRAWSPPLSVTCTRSEMPRSDSAMVMELATSSRNAGRASAEPDRAGQHS